MSLVAVTIAVQAQNSQGVDQRQKNQRHRIQKGVITGELTRPKALDARRNQRQVRRAERRVEADGMVTSGEKAKLHHKQNKASRQLRRDKHDRQDRPRAN